MNPPSPSPRTVARVLVPAAILFLLLGMAISARIYYSTHPYKPGEVVLSDFESCEENPRGYIAAATGTALACCLLFPAALLFARAFRGSWWTASGSFIYGAGCASGGAMGALEPFNLYELHIVLAYITFLGLMGGLGCLSVAAARARLRPGRGMWAAAAMVYLVTILLVLELVPVPKRGSFGFWNSLGAEELAMVALVASGTAGLATAFEDRASKRLK